MQYKVKSCPNFESVKKKKYTSLKDVWHILQAWFVRNVGTK